MQKIATKLQDCYILEPTVYGDDRGYFTEFYSKKTMEALGLGNIIGEVVQGNRSLSRKGTLRGLHYQKGKTAQAKLVECLQGSVLDVVVDLRKSSPSYQQWISVELTGENQRKLLVPKGFAHGFLTLEDNTLFQYLVDYPYSKETEGGFLWKDEEIGVDWQLERYGIDQPLLSAKDEQRKPLKETDVEFL